MTELSGKCVMVIGGESELGRALTIGLAEGGADVAIASLTQGKDAEFAVASALNELWAMDRQGVGLIIDASDEGEMRAATLRGERELGRIDLAAVVAEGGDGVALEALGGALGDRPVIEIAPDGEAGDALRVVSEAL